MTRPARKLDPVTEAMASSAYRIQSMAEGLDEVAHAMERKWGVGRLRLLPRKDLMSLAPQGERHSE